MCLLISFSIPIVSHLKFTHLIYSLEVISIFMYFGFHISYVSVLRFMYLGLDCCLGIFLITHILAVEITAITAMLSAGGLKC